MYERYYSTCQEMCRGLGTVRKCQGGEERRGAGDRKREGDRDKAKEKKRGGCREEMK